MNNSINSPVSITSIGFDSAMRSYPKRMEWQGNVYHFISHGVRLNVRRGEACISTLICSDGKQDFCLRQSGQQWTLVSMG